jgi:hypothetical protein
MFWSQKTALEAARGVVGYVQAQESLRSSRRESALKYGSLYEGLQMSSLAPQGYAVDTRYLFESADGRGTDVPVVRNTCHAVVDTFVSKIGALDTPKPAMLTTEGSWRDRRQAEDLERLVEAEYLSPKGGFSTLNELWIHALRIAAAATGTVAVHYYNDNGRVNARIRDTLDMVTSHDGRVMAVITWYDVEDLVEMFPDREDDIRAAKQEPPIEFRAPKIAGTTQPEMVALYEGWRGASGKKPGTYVAALDSDVDALVFEDYEHEHPPIVWLNIDPHLYGPYGNSLTHHAYESCFRDNAIIQAIDRSISKTNKSVTYADESSITNKEALDVVEDNITIWVNTTAGTLPLPTTVSPQGFNSAHINIANMHKEDVHDVTGIGQMHTGGKREPGIDSAIGQRTVAALINERFAAVQRRYVQAVAVDSAKVIIQILCDIFQDDRKLTRHWPGQDSIREVSAAVALRGIEALKYVIQPAAVSGSKNSPADRQQTAFELFKSGILSQDAYAGLQQAGYDLPEELDSRDTQREWLDKQMNRYMFASDKEVAKPDFYVPPLRHMNPERALLRLIDGFLEAQMEQLEDERLEFYLMMMADLDSIMAANDPLDQQTPQQAQQVLAA